LLGIFWGWDLLKENIKKLIAEKVKDYLDLIAPFMRVCAKYTQPWGFYGKF
jgi:hypothetical protein